MINPRKYGTEPYKAAVIHGGPGAGGEMAPVARELSLCSGVLEPIQTAASIDGQTAELDGILRKNGAQPIVLIGFSWGAWLSFIYAARNPTRVSKLILIGCGPFEERHAGKIRETRLSRLGREERKEAAALIDVLQSNPDGDKNGAFARFGELFSRADAYDPVITEPDESETIECRFDIFQTVWAEAVELRKSGELLKLGESIICPVVAIHGDYDPHPAEGVHEPLAGVLSDFRIIILEECGHKPWMERRAKKAFYDVLKEELLSARQGTTS
jgi:pimeloyl-ACP methyl ester carboxylesterase